VRARPRLVVTETAAAGAISARRRVTEPAGARNFITPLLIENTLPL
jgi:hypothetical protein